MTLDVRDTLSEYDTENVYDENGTCCECFMVGMEQAVVIILHAQTNGTLPVLLDKMRTGLL